MKRKIETRPSTSTMTSCMQFVHREHAEQRKLFNVSIESHRNETRTNSKKNPVKSDKRDFEWEKRV